MKIRINDKDFGKALQQEFSHKELVTTQDLKKYLENIYPDYNSNSLYWIISDLNKRGIIHRVTRGYYKIKEVVNNKMVSVVLMGDIKSSRDVYAGDPNFELRIIEKVKRDFHKVDKNLEVTYSTQTLFDIVFGDEINYYSQLNNTFMKKLLLILYHVRPSYFRFVLAAGKGVEKEVSGFSKMNNQIFWNARDLFNSEEFKNVRGYKYNAIIWPQSEVLQNSLLTLILNIISNWTDKQWEVVYQRLFDISYKEIGKNIGISFQAVHERLSTAKFELVSNSFSELIKLMRGV